MPDQALETMTGCPRDQERLREQLTRVHEYRDLVHRMFGDLGRELDDAMLNAVRRADVEQQRRVLLNLDADLRRMQKLLEALA